MRFAFLCLALSLPMLGCGQSEGRVADDDELSAYLAENPSGETPDPGTDDLDALE